MSVEEDVGRGLILLGVSQRKQGWSWALKDLEGEERRKGFSGQGRARTKWVVVTMTLKHSRDGKQTSSSLDSEKTQNEKSLVRGPSQDPAPRSDLAQRLYQQPSLFFQIFVITVAVVMELNYFN